MNNPILEIKGLCKHFSTMQEDLCIINNLDLVVESSARVAISGESGCGKSTLLNIIGGLEASSSGTVIAGPYNVHALDEAGLTKYRSSYLGLVFQFHYLLKDFTALENVMLPAFISGMKKKEAIERARALLVDVNLEHRLNHFPSQLSGGERQRAAVARSLINSPSLVLADEPTGNLDPANSEVIRSLLFDVVTKYNKTLLIVTHDLETANLADIHYKLVDSRLVIQ